jgi:hypothetical protein
VVEPAYTQDIEVLVIHCQWKNAGVQDKIHLVKSMHRQEELGKIRAIGYGIAFVVIIVVTLWRLIPR